LGSLPALRLPRIFPSDFLQTDSPIQWRDRAGFTPASLHASLLKHHLSLQILTFMTSWTLLDYHSFRLSVKLFELLLSSSKWAMSLLVMRTGNPS
jgi:hypothetical protein